MTTILAIDPGTRNTGYAVLTSEEQLVVSGTFILRHTLRGVERQLWLLSRMQDLILEHQPGVLAYEDFTWFSGEEGTDRYVKGRPDMERLIGGMTCLALQAPFPVLMGLFPSRWSEQLTGVKFHTKEGIAHAVNCRLKTRFAGNRYDNHACDATGIALVAHDLLRQQSSYNRYHVENTHYAARA